MKDCQWYFAVALVVIASALFGCQNDKGKNIPDVSHIPAKVNIQRFEKALFSIDTNDVSGGLVALEREYPEFLSIYTSRLLPSLKDTNNLAGFLRDGHIQHLYDTTLSIFPNLSRIEGELAQAFQYYQYYFPNQKPPRVVSYISEYTLGSFTYGETLLAIGLDFFLGAGYPYYSNNVFPAYIRRSMDGQHVAAKAIKTLTTGLVGEPTGNNLLSHMVHNGKVLYIVDHLLPHMPDSIKLEYTALQTRWCEGNELQMWAYLLGEDLLYSTDLKRIRKFIDHSPNSPGMPDEAPGRTANWLGWQIVKRYMSRYTDTTFDELVALKDAQAILEKSKYKPK